MKGWVLAPLAPHHRARLAPDHPAPLVLRADMAAQFAAEDLRLPEGPAWSLCRDGDLVAIGGVEPAGGAHGTGWLLCGDLDRREWAMVRRALIYGVQTLKRWRTTRFVHALAEAGRPGAVRLLQRMGFEAKGREGAAVRLTLEVF